MSQDYTSESRKARRAARNRNRPILVTSTSEEQEAQSNGTISKEAAPSEVASAMPVQELPPLIIPTPPPTKPKGRTLPGFLPSRKSTDEQPKEAKEADIAQARLARATRKIPATTSKATDIPEKDVQPEKSTTPKAASPAITSKPNKSASARPASAFKTRYIFGMVLYLLCANFIGVFEQGILQSYHLDAELTRFNLFGAPIIIRTSTLAFLLTLVVILVILARLDLIPRSLGAAMGTPARKSTSTSNTSANSERTQQPTIRQGVQGADDKLYQEYRTAQRREKKNKL